MSGNPVLPPVQALTEEEARHLLAAGLLRATHEQGPTRVGLTIGCNEKTVRDARDKKSTLRVDLSWNALLADAHALDAIAAHFRKRLVPIDAKCDSDALSDTAGAVHVLAVAKSPTSPGGINIVDQECLAMEAEVDAAIASLQAIKNRCIAIRTERAA